MDELTQKALREVQAKTRSSVPWRLDEPRHQPYYAFHDGAWSARNAQPQAASNVLPSMKTLAIYSWNIDFMLPFPESRMLKGIDHLKTLVESSPDASTANIIYLQECVKGDIDLISSQPWVRSNFNLSDIDISNWQSGHYGTITLADSRLAITSCYRVHYSQTRMERDGLFVEVSINGKNITTCNTHLESLALEPPYRPAQMKLCAEYMKRPEVDGAIVAGDFNAIQDFDRTLHEANGLKDAYLELGGTEDDAANGHTWGQQAATRLRQQFGTSRMDKVFFCGSVKLLSLARFGADVCVDDKDERDTIVQLGFDKPWITDHLGVKAVFDMSDSSKSSL